MSSALRKRFSSLFIPTLVIAVLVHEIWTTPVYTDHELAAMRESAVALARQGDVAAAIEKLRALSEVAPRDHAVWGDYLTELVRARRDDEALTLYRNHRTRPLPDYALAELFDAALRTHDLVLARELADREIGQSSDREQVAIARNRALGDASAALEPVSAPAVAVINPAPVAAETAVARPDHGAAVESTNPGSAKMPQSSRNKAVASSSIKSQRNLEPRVAAPAHTDAIADQISLAERARNAVREAEQVSAAERVARAQAALPILVEYETSLPPDSTALRNAKLDRVRALTLANQLDEGATLFESLGDANQMPFYGVMNGADLYARRHEPERAKALLDIAGHMQPNARELLIAQFYNQLDLERFDLAAQTLAQLREISPDESAQRDTEIIAAMFAAYQNQLDDAQTRLEYLRRQAPDNADIQLRLAQIYRWRGWPRRALAEYRAVAERLDDPVSAQVGEIATLNDLHAFRIARLQLQQLSATVPNHPEVLQAQHEQSQRKRWEYSAYLLNGQSSGNPVTGTGDMAFEQKLYSPELDDQFRAFVHQRYDWAQFPGDSGDANRFGVGGDYRSPAVDVAAEISDRMPGGQLGVSASGEWKFDDRLSVFGEIQTDSTLIPLRALHADIDGHSIMAGVRYRVDETRDMRAGYSRADFSDGNQRDAFSVQYQQSIFQDAHNQLSAVVEGYHSRNSAGSDVPYYNPSSEFSVGARVIYSGILQRRYERSWSHQVSLGAGDYAQQDFGSGAIWDVEYGQRWQLSDALGFNYGALYRSRIYDGSREGYSAIYGGVNWRF